MLGHIHTSRGAIAIILTSIYTSSCRIGNGSMSSLRGTKSTFGIEGNGFSAFLAKPPLLYSVAHTL